MQSDGLCNFLQLTERIEGFNVGFLEEGFAKCDESVQQIVKNMQAEFEAAGASVEWLTVPQHNTGRIFNVF